MSHFSGMSVQQRWVLHSVLNTQQFRDTARRVQQGANTAAIKALVWERAAVAAGMLVELTDMMVTLKDPSVGDYDRKAARMLFDTIAREILEHGYYIHDAPVSGQQMGRRSVVAPPVHP